jgi:hypothetical protein
MTLSRTLAAAGAAVLLSTALVGCGSSDSSGDKGVAADKPALTKAEFQTQANKLCAAANKDTESYGANISEKSTDAEVSAAIDKTVQSNQELVDAIDALYEPQDLSADVASMLNSVKAGMAELDKVSSVQDLMSFDPNSGSFKDANDKATKLGLDTCAQ